MASQRGFTINGHSFLFQFGHWQGNGVCLEPGTAELDNPEYLNALKVALALYPELERFYDKIEGSNPASEPFVFTPELDFPEYARGYVESLRSLINTELQETIQSRELYSTEIKQSMAKREAERRVGFVYIILNTRLNIYKIGKSKNPQSRIKGIALQTIDPIETIHVFAVKDMGKSESFLHNHFQEKRVTGEWFRLENADLETAKSLMEAQS